MSANSIKPSQGPYPQALGPAIGQSAQGKANKAQKSNPLAKPAPIAYQPAPKVVRPMSEYGANIVKGFVNLFSMKTIKALGAKGAMVGAGLAGGVAIAIFAGPQIQAAFLGLAASAVFPPVAIAVGATLGAALLAFGIYKLVQMGKAKLKAEAEARAAQAQSFQAEPATLPGYAVPGPEFVQPLANYAASVKSKAPSQKPAPSVAKSTVTAKPMAPVPEMSPEMASEEMQAWSNVETKTKA